MPLELFIAWRYLKARRKGVFTLLTTLIAIGGITLGVAALIITLAVMSGFHRDIREKILGIQPHLVVLKGGPAPFNEYPAVAGRIKQHKEVVAAAPFIYGQAILKNNQSTAGAVIKGIEAASEDSLIHLGRTVISGHLPGEGTAARDILLGQELARTLGLTLGDEVIVVSPGQLALIPRMEKFTVTGIFQSGMYEYDSSLSFVSLAQADKLFGMEGSVTGIGISVKDWEKTGRIEAELQKDLAGPYWVRSWERMNHNLFAALKLEKIMMFIILTLIILVAAFNIISNLLLLTVEKTKEIGILSAMGFHRFKIAKVFFYEGIIIGLSGILLGVGLGTGISLLLKKYQFIHLPPDVYYLDTLPVRILAGDVASVTVATLVITMLAAIYPAYQVTKLDPLEAIRYG
ncbi:MAG: FtsX-like permease family protein [Endomicrobiales bacterium]